MAEGGELLLDDYPSWEQAVDERGRPVPIEAQDRPWRPGVDPQAAVLADEGTPPTRDAIARAAAIALARETAAAGCEAVPHPSPAPLGDARGPWPKRPMPCPPRVLESSFEAVPAEDPSQSMRPAALRSAAVFGLEPVQQPPRAKQARPPPPPTLPVPTAFRAPRHEAAACLDYRYPSAPSRPSEAVPAASGAAGDNAASALDSSDDEAVLLEASLLMERRIRLPVSNNVQAPPVPPALSNTPAGESPRPPPWVLRVFRARDACAEMLALLGPEARTAASCLHPRIRDACLVAAPLASNRWDCPSAAFLHVAHAAWGTQVALELDRHGIAYRAPAAVTSPQDPRP